VRRPFAVDGIDVDVGAPQEEFDQVCARAGHQAQVQQQQATQQDEQHAHKAHTAASKLAHHRLRCTAPCMHRKSVSFTHRHAQTDPGSPGDRNGL